MNNKLLFGLGVFVFLFIFILNRGVDIYLLPIGLLSILCFYYYSQFYKKMKTEEKRGEGGVV